jgi:hypothetical protein
VTHDHLVVAAFAVPGVFLAAQILTGKWSGRRGRNLGWALFGVPIVAIGVHSHSWAAIGGGIALFASPYRIERTFNNVWPPRH